MKKINTLCVYCGSSENVDRKYRAAAERLGALMAKHGVRLVFGGGGVGLMGSVADAVLAGGGEAIGIMPDFLLDIEVGHRGVKQMITVDSMHARKQKMFDMADAFVILPGGFGTLDETLEILTWKQLRRHDKPILIVNVDGYWNPFLNLLDAIIEKGFARQKDTDLYTVVCTVEEILPALATVPEPTFRTASSEI